MDKDSVFLFLLPYNKALQIAFKSLALHPYYLKHLILL
ncbi:hypothetical protein DSM01_2639 [Leeuwenhoekiella palythoae]|uniref:Uncharacterized protein n=1 Tax=Leeuwenhoekiella palythoae TaxID=573501 RepID=A0ABY0D254_9FLAO|nr:hypothetical protein DSM01_2639 [Leeuwenhoekiella palythoae]